VVSGLGLVYAAVFFWRPAWLGRPLLAGSLGVLLGLYICSNPAANAIDRLFFGRGRRAHSSQAETVWLAANCAVLLVGLLVIIIGATRFSIPSR
jgi:hypothetical protein